MPYARRFFPVISAGWGISRIERIVGAISARLPLMVGGLVFPDAKVFAVFETMIAGTGLIV